MSEAFRGWTLVETAARVAAREVSGEEVARAAIARAEAAQPALNAFIHLEAEAALRQARAVDAAIRRGEAAGPLAGAPLAHKDMYYRAGRLSTAGSAIRRDFVPSTTASVLTRLDRAGALDLGGLNMSEFAVGPTGHNRHYGDCHNPWNLEHAPGGSSSGSGASVAAGVLGGALGSDTGGSIRIPSAMSGVVGLKPTQTRVSRHGILPLSFSFDCVGPLTRTVRDAARILSVIAGRDAADSTSSTRPVPDYEAGLDGPVGELRLGVPTSYYYDGLTAEVAGAVAAARAVFADLGVAAREVEVPSHEEMNLIWPIALSAEAATIHRRWLRERPGDYQPQVRRRIEVGLYQPATRYIEVITLRQRFTRDFVRLALGQVDALIVPTAPMPSPRLADVGLGDDERMVALVMKISAMTRPINFLGLPSLSVPCGFTEAGLPMAFQLIGRPFAEATLFRLGHAYQEATGWWRRLPELP